MKEIVLHANTRKVGTKGELNAIRNEGMIPAVAYGGKKNNIPIVVPIVVKEKDFTNTIHTHQGMNVIISLNIKGEKETRTVIVKEVQQDPISEDYIHIDFQEISLKEKIEVEVPIGVVGLAPGVQEEGGVLDQVVREIGIKCLPTKIPDKIVIDVSQLNIGDTLTIADLQIPRDVEVLEDRDKIVASVIPPTILEEPKPEEALAEEMQEPEVIGKGKKVEEEEEVEEKGEAKEGAKKEEKKTKEGKEEK